jgi:hypothetical protein
MSRRVLARTATIAVLIAAVLLGLSNHALVEAATNWIPGLAASSHGEGHAQPAITTLTGNPATFGAACASSGEGAVLTWSSAGSAVTGYEVLVSATLNGSYTVDATQPTGTALTVTETYTTAGNRYYRLEAASSKWAFPGTTVTNAREAAVGGTNGGYLTMSSSTPNCTATP